MWGKGIDKAGLIVLLVSRVAAHCTAFAQVCVERALELAGGLPNLGNVIHLYQDGGAHFKSYTFLGSVGLGLHEAAGKESIITYGAPCHFKNPNDSTFGTLGKVFEAAATRTIIRDQSDVAKVFQSWAEESQNDPNAPKVIVEEFWPKPKDRIQQYTLDPASLPVGIKSCFQWEFTRDKKQGPRVSMFGRGANRLVATSTWLLPRPFPSAKTPAGARGHPSVLEDVGLDEETPEEQADRAGLQQKNWNGWRLFYRSAEPEKVSPDAYSKKTRRLMNQMGMNINDLPWVATQATEAMIKSRSDARAAKRKVRARHD